MARKGASGAIEDFFVKLGFDGKAVQKGLGNLQREFRKFNTEIMKSQLGQSKLVKENLKAQQEAVKLKKEEAKLAQENAKTVVQQAKADKEKSIAATKALQVEAAKGRVESTNLRVAQQQAVLTRRKNIDEARSLRHEQSITNMRIKALGTMERFKIKYGNRFSNTHASMQEEVTKIFNEAEGIKERAGTINNSTERAKLFRDLGNLRERADILARSNDKLNRSLTAGAFAAKGFSDSLRNMARSYLSVFAVIAGGGEVIRTGQELVSLRATLLGVSGDAKIAARDFEWLKDVSKSLGINLTEATRSYGKIGAAAKAAGLDMDQGREIFLATSELATAFNLTDADFEGVSRAMGQILSKGKVSTEELLQLGERIPIVFDSAAQALGVTTKQLYKEIEKGTIQSVDFAPEVIKYWRQYVRETGMLTQQLKSSRVAMQRFGTTFKENVLNAFDEGMEGGLGNFFNDMSRFLEDHAPLFKSLGVIFGNIFSAMSTVVLALGQATRMASRFLWAIVDSGDKANTVIGSLVKAFKTLAATMVLPFALLEKWNDKVETTEFDKRMSRVGTATKNESAFTQMVEKFGLLTHDTLSIVPEWFGIQTPDYAKYVEGKYGNTTSITVYANDAQDVANKLRPYLTGDINERINNMVTTAMHPASGG